VILLPGALEERLEEIAQEFTGSCLLGTGQFCTNPGLILLLRDPTSEGFLDTVAKQFADAPTGVLLSAGVERSLRESIEQLIAAGAVRLAGDRPAEQSGFRVPNTLLKIDGSQFLENPATFQMEAFGPASLCVVADDAGQLAQIIRHLEGNLTGGIYSDHAGKDEALVEQLAPLLRQKVGRLLNDKMPTGVAVSPAMNHGGPYPATGHPGFTAVGIPASLRRFAMLQCFDAVRHARLPEALQDRNPNGTMWRVIDGHWSRADVE
jgi:NADP-dependent aldehyde dehydrogenase